MTCNNTQCAKCTTQHATRITQHTTRSMQHAACNRQHASHTACHVQRCNTALQHAALQDQMDSFMSAILRDAPERSAVREPVITSGLRGYFLTSVPSAVPRSTLQCSLVRGERPVPRSTPSVPHRSPVSAHSTLSTPSVPLSATVPAVPSVPLYP